MQVTEALAGRRLDALLSEAVPSLSRARVAWHIEHGHVTLDDPKAKLKPSFRPKRGSWVAVAVQPLPELSTTPEPLPLDVVFEDDWLLVVNKAAGMVVHPAPGHASGTLINGLLHHVPSISGVGQDEIRPGLVHRIDKDTSGLLVVSKTSEALYRLQQKFAVHDIERSYDAVCLGRLRQDALTVESLHGRHPRDRKRFSGRVSEGKRAVTHLEVVSRSRLCTWVRCRLETGRTHQIRVHLSERGHPIAGDTLYGGVRNHPKTPESKPEIAALGRLTRQALHASTLGFEHPMTGAKMRFEAPLPRDLRDLTAALFSRETLD